jgi:Tol biopolymer transport system component
MVSKSTLEEEASSDMNPVISLDGKYISVDRRQCGSDSGVDVFEIKTGKSISIDNETCSKLFNWVAK